MKYRFLLLALGLLLVAAACNKQKPTNPGPAADQNSQVLSGSVEIKMIANGFEPNSVTIKQGTKVSFVNTDSNPHWPASVPHPTHTDYPGFDPLQAVSPGENWTFSFDKVGTWGYHDHLNPSTHGTIIVTQ